MARRVPRPCPLCGTPTRGHCCTQPRNRNLARQYLDTIYQRDNATCHLCHQHVPRPQATLDHIVALNNGGTDHPTNLALACHSCNSNRQDNPPR